MKLYHWTSEYLEQYCDGDIFVLANSVEEAREKARAKYLEHSGGCDYKSDTFEKDIAVEPGENTDVYFIWGSA